ncbi:LINE-1 reverse transcriptase isogeny [Gossypium australe]|uniref:LINE-1 reverse transcriptase isogeny n=1 Tax=Gossypium australe TaxID=47621 RepID=A0A5B6V7A8_9ROSI|nr:LINE-1 reverse transcriptase isogeny [Gossypium australe]
MAPLKVLGSDGFLALFFQKQWDIVGIVVCDWVKKVFTRSNINAELNNTLIVLIPKVQNSEDLSQFLPIRLYTITVIAQDVIHSMKSNKSRKWMAIKIDLEKAYDRMRWEFIDSSLQVADLMDGVLTSKFKPVRGIRQGCILSPYLFVFCIEWLGHSISSTLSKGIWNSIRLSCSGSSPYHFFFVDDLVIFYETDAKNERLLKELLHDFCKLSRHKVNLRKINIFFSKGVEESMSSMLSNLLRFQKVHDLGHYLGVPLFHQRVTNNTMHFLQSWDARQLFIVGQAILAQSVLLSISGYFMQSMMIPRKICDEVESLARTFI